MRAAKTGLFATVFFTAFAANAADPPRTHLEPVPASEQSDIGKLPEFTDRTVVWMEAGYAFGAYVATAALQRTDDGFRLVYLNRPIVIADDPAATADLAADEPKPARCVYAISAAQGNRILAAARVVLRKTRPGAPNLEPMGVDLEFIVRDGAKLRSGRVSNPVGDSEPSLLATVFTPFDRTCPQSIAHHEGDLETALGRLERALRSNEP